MTKKKIKTNQFRVAGIKSLYIYRFLQLVQDILVTAGCSNTSMVAGFHARLNSKLIKIKHSFRRKTLQRTNQGFNFL